MPRTNSLQQELSRPRRKVVLKRADKEPSIESWLLDGLKPHPLQGQYFEDLSDDALAAVAADIKANGLKEKIEILPDGTILSGHQRRRALMSLGRTETKVKVRHDLAGDAAAAEDYFLKANMLRRHLDPLSQARVALRRFAIEKGREAAKMIGPDEQTARDRVGKTLGMSGRNLQRYWNVLKAPHEVQEAFRAGELTLNEATRVGLLTAATQAHIAQRICNGEPAKAVVAGLLNRKPGNAGVDLRRRWRQFIAAMNVGTNELAGNVDEIAERLTEADLVTVRTCRRFLGQIIKSAESKATIAAD